jgi:hypothetical protein
MAVRTAFHPALAGVFGRALLDLQLMLAFFQRDVIPLVRLVSRGHPGVRYRYEEPELKPD